MQGGAGGEKLEDEMIRQGRQRVGASSLGPLSGECGLCWSRSGAGEGEVNLTCGGEVR